MSLERFAKAEFAQCVLSIYLGDPNKLHASHFTLSPLFLIAKADANAKVCVSPFNYFIFEDSKWCGHYVSIHAISEDFSLPIPISKLSYYEQRRRSYCKIKIKPPISHIFQLFSFTKKYNFSFVKDSDLVDYLNEMIIFPLLILQKNYPSFFDEFYSTIVECVSFLHKYIKKMYKIGNRPKLMEAIKATNELFVEYIRMAHVAYLKEAYENDQHISKVLSKYKQAIDEKVELWKNNN